MKRKRVFLTLVMLFGVTVLGVFASDTQSLKLRFFEGIKEGMVDPPDFVTSSYLHSTNTAKIRTNSLLSEEQDQIKNVYNLKDVHLISEADLKLGTKKKDQIKHTFRLNGTEYLIIVQQVVHKRKRQYRLEVYEQTEEAKNSLLNTEIQLPSEKSVVFGFADKQEKPYFLSLGIPKPLLPEPARIDVGGAGGISIEELERGAIKAVGETKPPQLINKVDPVYPELARLARVEGIVILNVRTDEDGRVDQVKVAVSNDPLLSRAATEAVKQWRYQPFYSKGVRYPILFTVTVRFQLSQGMDEDSRGREPEENTSLSNPKTIYQVDPVYPERARRARIEGIVMMRVKTDNEGNVNSITVLRSDSLILNQAAIDAVEQWKYQPSFRNGIPVPIVTIVSVKFRLD
ncbi:MAG: energy transducer TonB [Candidatus Aminicenantes bacterium]|nr:energy transducer TonB [Candidatus Aminicenantes bacterium]